VPEVHWCQHGLWVSRKIPAISGHRVDARFLNLVLNLSNQHTSHFGTPSYVATECATLRSSSMLDADNRRAMIFPRSFVGEILEGRPVLSSSPEIETLLHTMALVLNRVC